MAATSNSPRIITCMPSDMFLLHAILAKPDREYMDKLERMAEYLHAVLGPSRELPFLGDDDGGRLFHPYGERRHFARATIATASIVLDKHRGNGKRKICIRKPCGGWEPARSDRKPGEGKWESRLFSDVGVAVMTSGVNQVIFDAGAFGPWGAGHSHADALSIVVRSGDTRDSDRSGNMHLRRRAEMARLVPLDRGSQYHSCGSPGIRPRRPVLSAGAILRK